MGSPARADRYTFKPQPASSHSLALAWLPEPGQGRRVLDVGCGPGHVSRILAERGYRLTGVDREAPEDDSSGVEFVRRDLIAGLGEVGAPYPFVLCLDVLEHLPEPLSLLREIESALAPGGRVIASLPNSGNIYVRWHALRGHFPKHDRGLFDRTHLHFFSLDGWKELFGSAGFVFEEIVYSGIPFHLAFPGREGNWAIRAMEGLAAGLARVWPRLFAYQFVVKVRRR